MSTLDALAGIGLADLTARAGLMTRVDRKYLVPREEIEDLLEGLTLDLRVLEIEGRRRFAYRSTYYDTGGLDAFRAAATGRRRRWKVRQRDYVDTGTSFLEVKTRTGRGESAKARIAVTADGHGTADGCLAGPALDFVRGQLSCARCAVPAGPLLPALITAYDRTTLLVANEDSRLTIDQALEWTDPVGHGRRLQELTVVETKAGTRPGSVDRALWRAGHRPQRLSKYATGLALLDADLSANRWHRTVRGIARTA